jgi:nucleotide-binding universal stress UspA family protein
MSRSAKDSPVLFAYDGSEESKAAIELAGQQLVGRRRAIVLTVWQPLPSVPFAAAPMVPQTAGIDESQESAARRIADDGVKRAQAAGFDARPEVRGGGAVWEEIVAAAEEHRAGLVVMGSHGRTGLGLVLLGSVATAAARHTDRPVLIAHAQAR